jgi:hypothetical protein
MLCKYFFGLGWCLAAMMIFCPVTAAQAKEPPMKIALQASLTPGDWSGSEMQDVTIRLVLKNTSEKPITVYPSFTDLSWKTSVASMGMSWVLNFESPAEPGSAAGRELRTYYGPPGEPVSEDALRRAGVVIKPGKEKTTTLKACWIPRALLHPDDLSLAVLDPQGYDNLKAIPRLGQASVLVFNADRATLKNHPGKQQGLLRGYMVVFFQRPGRYVLRAAYRQTPVMCKVVQPAEAAAEPVAFTAGGK